MREKSYNQTEFAKLWANPRISIPWTVVMFLVNITIGVSLQQMLVVLWVKGFDAYFSKGVRVLPIKPAKFSDGMLVPMAPDAIFGLAVFITLSVALAAILVLIARLARSVMRRSGLEKY
jgi:hypothetical protein